MNRFVITGTSGTGKTSLVEELGARGFLVFGEAARKILTEQLTIDGPGLPAKDPVLFVQMMLQHCIQCLGESERVNGPVFFDRGVPDVAAYAVRFGIDPSDYYRASREHTYNQKVFLLPPWEEIFVKDNLRGKSFEAYAKFHETIQETYRLTGFSLIDVPFVSIDERANFILSTIGNSDS